MGNLPSELLAVGGTSAGFGVIAYLIVKLLERYSGSEDYYKGRLADVEKERDVALARAHKAEITAEKCKQELRTLKRHAK